MGPFGGWDMPIQYEGILAEHLHTRTKTSLFDICHMGEFDLKGPTAEQDLERLLTQRISTLKEGQCRYGYLLREDGGVLDDLTCYRRGSQHFMLVVNAGTSDQDAEWIQSHLSNETEFTDLSSVTAKLDVQGPESRAAFERALGIELPDLKYFRFVDLELNGTLCTLSRTGYTGEWGYELYLPWDRAKIFWDLFLAEGTIKPAGLGARDTLRLEVGYPLYGHELSTVRTPVAVSRGQFIDTSKDFIGRESVVHDIEGGVPKYLVGLALETRRAAREHDQIVHEGKVVGEITSGSIAPSLNVAIAMAYLDSALCEEGQGVEVDVRGKRLPARVVGLPFYKKGSVRGPIS